MSKILGNYFNRKIFRIAIIATIVVLVIYPFVFSKKSFANEISLFPTICEGSWKNVSEASGDPVDNRLGGAESTASGDMIACHSFDLSSLPHDAVITDTHLELVWASGNIKKQFIQPSIEESYDPLAPVTEGELLEPSSEINEQGVEVESHRQEPQLNTLETQTAPLIEQKNIPVPVNEIKIDSTNSDITPEPTSRIPDWIHSLFISEVKAEDALIPVENSIISNDNQPATNVVEVAIPETKPSKEITSEIIVPESVTTTKIPETGDNSTESSKIQTDTSSENIPENSITAEEASRGTALYNLSYTLNTKTEHHLASVTQEHLSNVYPLLVTVEDVAVLKVSLTSLMTFDEIDSLSLEGIKLVVSYTAGESLDPIRQPDIEVDTILDNIIVEDIQAIRLKRDDNKQFEIWYRTLDPEELIANNRTEHTLDTKREELTIAESSLITESISTDLPLAEIKSKDLGITQTEKLVIESSEKDQISRPTNTIKPEITSIDKSSNKKKKLYWNFIDGDDSVNRSTHLGLRDGYIFWLNKKGTVLNSFNILTQGYNSQFYQPDSGIDFIMYRSPSSQEKKAILNMTEKKFIFPE